VLFADIIRNWTQYTIIVALESKKYRSKRIRSCDSQSRNITPTPTLFFAVRVPKAVKFNKVIVGVRVIVLIARCVVDSALLLRINSTTFVDGVIERVAVGF
jgi:hypothetical protein